ncbi:MAG: RnfABCDGE type electron transport complex subunit G [Clostridia bacterium]|nr:RnfABCDGE type electron transport complex subunit G [Clostridia bacterium]
MRKTLKFLYPTLILAAICLVVSLALSSTDMITKARIAEIEAKNTEKAMSRVLKAETYTEKTLEEDGEEINYYEASDGDTLAGLIFITSANGYGGEVKVMTAILPDKSIKAVEILDVSSETPGLGQNAAKESFYGQFSGISGGSDITVVKSGGGDMLQINAITGATITSRAVTKAVNEARKYSEKILPEEADDE